VWRLRRIAPEHDAAGGALTFLQARRLLRIAWPTTGTHTQLGLALSGERHVDAVRVAPTVGRQRAEHRTRVMPHQPGLAAPAGGRIVVGKRAPAGDRGRGHRHLLRGHIEPPGEVAAHQVVVALLGRRPEQARGIHRLMALAVPDLDQVVAAEDPGDTQLGRLEVDALAAHDDVEDRV
jgi:hypothetical protein